MMIYLHSEIHLHILSGTGKEEVQYIQYFLGLKLQIILVPKSIEIMFSIPVKGQLSQPTVNNYL